MPAAIYAISYQDTGAILSYCQLEQRDLSPKGAVDVLRDQLIDEELAISLRKPDGSPIKIAKEHLRVDEVDVAKLQDFLRAPYKFVLDLSDATAKPGDGKKKSAILPTAPAPTLTLNSGTQTTDPNMLVVTRPAQFPSETELFVIIDGQEQSIKVAAPTNTVKFAFSSAQNQVYSVLFASRGVTPFFGLKPAQ